ncbi:uncharacterized protein LOC115689068 [Syzygium oleosum]|uniref:uncharacterized protein LOC115689068 n=1 Tax=Syzygium oleosum TaxID=219896 RepID=UPI0024B971C3|nr:uncharacterized protein LOC115689068 [Syzygium oleosum]
MEWWNMLLSPVRRAWLALSSRLKPRRHRDGLLKLHHDIQTCEYEDVQVMWEMLQRSELEQIANNSKGKQRPFWRVFVWSSHSTSVTLSADHA